MAQIDTDQFPDPGLYLLWSDGGRLDLTRDRIEAHTRAMLDDPTKIPPHVKAAADYQPCSICPHRDDAEICHAIMTTLPFMDEIDRYMSYDSVVAVYRGEDDDVLHVRETVMQDALTYVSILALTQYCEVGCEYGKYFRSVDPLTPPAKIAAQLYRNIYVEAEGNMTSIEAIIRRMESEIGLTTRCQVARLQLISKKDAFVNAFVAAQTVIGILFMELNRRLKSA